MMQKFSSVYCPQHRQTAISVTAGTAIIQYSGASYYSYSGLSPSNEAIIRELVANLQAGLGANVGQVVADFKTSHAGKVKNLGSNYNMPADGATARVP